MRMIRLANLKLKQWLPDAMLLAGAGSLSYGAWLAYAPSGFIVAGAFTIYAGLRLAE